MNPAAEGRAQRVVMVLPGLGNGGAERTAVQVAAYWTNAGRRVTLITLSGVEADFHRLPAGVDRLALNLASHSSDLIGGLFRSINRILRLRREIRDLNPDAVVAFTVRTNVLVVFASLRCPWLVVVADRSHPGLEPLKGIWRGLRRVTYRLADAVVAQTETSAAWLRAHTFCRRVDVIPNIRWSDLRPGFTTKPDQTPPKDGHLLLAVGRLGPEKGFDLLIEAFASLYREHASWRLVIVGEGSERLRLEGLAKGLPVDLPGVQADLAPWYQRADLFVLSSRLEGFPNVLLEALAAGCPAVSFDCPAGPAELIRHGVNGELVVPGDVAALASTLNNLMMQGDKRARYSQQAAASVSRYSEHEVMPLWDQLLDNSRS